MDISGSEFIRDILLSSDTRNAVGFLDRDRSAYGELLDPSNDYELRLDDKH